jgi:cell division protein FtsI/penicillin-binding protein 2
VPTFADSTTGDQIDGEDLVVRRAAVEALGAYNGSVIVSDPATGRILTMVNQKLALAGGFIPCSTVKLVTSIAAMNEGLISRQTSFRLASTRSRMDLTSALAQSDNPYFAQLGVKLGFDKVAEYARLLGLGEKAGLNIDGEEAGKVVDQAPKNGGVGMMTSFGEGIRQTPLQLAAMMGAIANGGTLYYLQHPTSQEEAANVTPMIKRELPIGEFVDDIKTGMRGATLYGTARRVSSATSDAVYGKTGTCTDFPQAAHMGWFGSFNEVGDRKLVVVVMLTGGKPVNGPVASGIAGSIYRSLADAKYLEAAPLTTAGILSTEKCCTVDLN